MADRAVRFLFRRPDLARRLVDALTGEALFSYAAGLFLAAPRRTGKSTFLRSDLVPELENRHITTVYVDLWANRDSDPGHLIAEAIKGALRNAEGLALKAARSTGLSKLGLGAFATLDIDRIGQPQGATLKDALEALLERTHKRLALIVDEAQHALISEAGMNAMFGLKAARDALNMREDSRGGPNLMLVFTGSHRDKLGRLVLGRDQPFFGASIVDFPLLGRDYADAYTAWINERLAPGNRFDPDDVHEAFTLVGHRPEHLESLLKDMALGLGDAGTLKTTLAENARVLRRRLWEDHGNAYSSLTPLQKAVLGRLIGEGANVAPFSAASLAAYANAVGEPVDASAVQGAIEALRQKNIIWRSARGQYALEDQSVADWFQSL